MQRARQQRPNRVMGVQGPGKLCASSETGSWEEAQAHRRELFGIRLYCWRGLASAGPCVYASAHRHSFPRTQVYGCVKATNDCPSAGGSLSVRGDTAAWPADAHVPHFCPR